MSSSFLYNKADGRLLEYTRPASPAEVLPGTGKVVFEDGEEPSSSFLYTHYYSDGIKERPTMPLSAPSTVLTGQPWTVTGIPAGTEVTSNGTSIVVNDGHLTWVSMVSGEFSFEFSCFPYMEETIRVSVSDV